MAGYVKIWTAILSDEKFLSLSALERGVFLQLIVSCKSQGDDGYVRVRSVAGVGLMCGCDRSTSAKCLRKFAEISLCQIATTQYGGVEIYIPNYLKWQEVTVNDMVGNNRKNLRKINEKSTLLDQSRPEQTRADTENSETSENQESKQEKSDIKNIERFVQIFHECCPTLPKLKKLTEPRIRLIRKLLKKQPNPDRWRGFFKHYVHASDFLAGRTDRGNLGLGFDWIFKPANYTKIIEGNYKNRPRISAAAQYENEDAVASRQREDGILAQVEKIYGAGDD